MATSTITIGQTVSGSGDPVDTFSFTVAAGQTLLMTLNGPTAVLAGIWTGTAAVPPNGVLRVCGGASKPAWGRHTFKASGPCVIQVTNPAPGGGSPGSYELALLKWTWEDNAEMNPLWDLYPSTC